MPLACQYPNIWRNDANGADGAYGMRVCYTEAMNREQIISSYMRELAGKRQRPELVCPICAATYRGLVWQRYCSNACRQRAKRARLKEQAAPRAD